MAAVQEKIMARGGGCLRPAAVQGPQSKVRMKFWLAFLHESPTWKHQFRYVEFKVYQDGHVDMKNVGYPWIR